MSLKMLPPVGRDLIEIMLDARQSVERGRRTHFVAIASKAPRFGKRDEIIGRQPEGPREALRTRRRVAPGAVTRSGAGEVFDTAMSAQQPSWRSAFWPFRVRPLRL